MFQSLLGIYLNWNLPKKVFFADTGGEFQSLLGIYLNWNNIGGRENEDILRFQSLLGIYLNWNTRAQTHGSTGCGSHTFQSLLGIYLNWNSCRPGTHQVSPRRRFNPYQGFTLIGTRNTCNYIHVYPFQSLLGIYLNWNLAERDKSR